MDTFKNIFLNYYEQVPYKVLYKILSQTMQKFPYHLYNIYIIFYTYVYI